MATATAARPLQQRLLGFSFEPGEARPTMLLAFYLLLAIASVIGLKAAGNSLFLDRFTARDLSLVYVAVAALMAVIVPVYLKLSGRLPLNRLIIYTQAFLAGHLVLFWWLLPFQLSWMPAVVYVWTEAYSVIITTQVWSLANQHFTTRQARRLFPLVSSGGLLGAALGGLYGRHMTWLIGTRHLILTYVFFLLVCACLVTTFRRRERLALSSRSVRAKQLVPTSLGASVRAVIGSRYLTLMTLLVALSAIVNILVDYQFRSIVDWELEREFQNPEIARDSMTALFAGFSSYLALFSFLMQLVLTSRIMRWFGLNFTIFVLPLSMLAGSGTLLFSSTLFAGMLIKGFDGVFRHSIDRSSTELLFVPLPAQLKQQAKSFIDMVAGRWAVGFGGVLLFFLVFIWGLNEQQISWVNITLILPWLAVAWLLRREYVQTLRSSIERRDTSAEALLMELAGSSQTEELTATLASSDERAVETGLTWLQYGQIAAAQSSLATLVTHVSPSIRRKAMSVIAAKDAPGCAPQIARFLYLDDQVDSLWAALEYLERHDPQQTYAKIHELLETDHPMLRATVAARQLALPESPHRARALEVLTAFVESARHSEASHKRRAAELLGRVPPDLGCQTALARFLDDPSPDVVRAAIVSAGRTRRRDLLPKLITLAGGRKLRTEARQALAAFGSEILPTLEQSLLDPKVPLPVRRNLPRVFSSIGGQQAAEAMARCLGQPDVLLEYQILRALSRIRLKDPSIRFDTDRVTNLTLGELRRYYEYVSILHSVPQNGASPGARFLGRALTEYLERKLEIIFRLIGLLYPPKDIFDAYYGVTSGRRDLRANALEFLDSVLLNPVRQMLLPILEDRSSERILEAARAQFGIDRRSYADVLRELMSAPDPWLRSCAIHAAADLGLRDLEPLLEPMLDTGDQLLQETVRAAHRRARARRTPAANPAAGTAVPPPSSSGAPWKP